MKEATKQMNFDAINDAETKAILYRDLLNISENKLNDVAITITGLAHLVESFRMYNSFDRYAIATDEETMRESWDACVDTLSFLSSELQRLAKRLQDAD